MPRRPAAYPAAYRERMIALAQARPTRTQLAAELEPSEEGIRNSKIFQATADRGDRPGVLTTAERGELTRLRRENRHGRGWHSLRRAFATDLKATPLKDLCQLRGWKSAATLLTYYQQADETTMNGPRTASGTTCLRLNTHHAGQSD